LARKKPSPAAVDAPSMVVKLHALTEHPPEVRPARAKRQWMDDFPDRHAYRCLPLSIANAFGWEVLCPIPVEIRWNGGPAVEDIQVIGLEELPGGASVDHFCRSNFSRGIITFHLDYVIETEPGWGILATGPFNDPKPTATPLAGVVESDWLPYPFTMNWQLMEPGITRFEEGEPFCFFLPVPARVLPTTELQIHRMADRPELAARHNQFREARDGFMRRVRAGDREAIKEAWQRHYFVGRHPDGVLAPEHLNKLRLREPVDMRSQPEAAPERPLPPIVDGPNPAIVASTTEPSKTDPRWAADSPLCRIATYSGTVTIQNRARIDAEGRFTPGPDTRIVSTRAEAEELGLDFLVADGLVSEAKCALLVRAFEELEELVFGASQEASFWDRRGLWYADVLKHRREAARTMLAALGRCLIEMKRFWKLNVPIYADGLHMMSWKAGLFMPPHADNAYPDGKPHELAYRDLSGVLYLNDGFEGGDLYLTAQDVLVKPRAGTLVSMTGDFHHEHGVVRVEGGLRVTIPFFATFASERADPALVELSERVAEVR
jgi:uncharacterized protein DUF6065/2-oxoglutarate-Fe(II)-dependent oxygenase superfamily protein